MVNNTQECIQRAVYELVCDRSTDQITVNDILRAANVSRPTFYRYFQDKYAVVYSIYDLHIQGIRETFLKNKDYKELLSNFYRIFYEHRVFYNNLLSFGQIQNSFYSYWEQQNYEQTFAEINHKRISDEITVAVSMVIHGSMHISMDLIQGKLNIPPEEAADYVIKNMPPVLKEILQVID